MPLPINIHEFLKGRQVEFLKSNLPLTKRLVAQIEGEILGI
jgi:hypothetical protein